MLWVLFLLNNNVVEELLHLMLNIKQKYSCVTSFLDTSKSFERVRYTHFMRLMAGCQNYQTTKGGIRQIRT